MLHHSLVFLVVDFGVDPDGLEHLLFFGMFLELTFEVRRFIAARITDLVNLIVS